MKKLLCFVLLLLVVGCGSEPVKAFKGIVDSVTKEEMEIDCSSAVKEKPFASEIEPKGYQCYVKITEDTKIFNIAEEEIGVDQLSSITKTDFPQYVEVTLVEEKIIDESVESREGLVAEIIRITEK